MTTEDSCIIQYFEHKLIKQTLILCLINDKVK